ncbi:hypothetical protein [Aeoliella mucimassa]|nr:hypothetical protein [Aeoliella mucimassa]
MSQVDVARLRKSLEGSEAELYREGRVEGFDWASKIAEAPQLKRLWKYRQDADEYWTAHFHEENSSIQWSHLGPIGTVIAAIVSDDPEEVEPNEISEFFDDAIGEENVTLYDEGEFMRGFFEGAIEAWEQAVSMM